MKQALFFLLIPFLASCSTPMTVREAVKVKSPEAPANLLTDCPVPELPEKMTFGDSVQLNMTLLLSIENCNGQLEAIREIELSRKGEKK